MSTFPSMRDVTLATLLVFGASCTFVSGPVVHYANGQPRPAGKPKPAGQPKPAPKPAPKPQPKPQPKPAPKPQPKPQPKPAPKPDPRPETPPAPLDSTHMVVPVRIGFDDTVERVDAMIMKTLTKDWHVVSSPKSATKVEAKYTVWRDPIKATFADRTLSVTVDVRYAADIRASTKIGKRVIWITKNDTWGTKSDPQVLTARFHAKFTIQDDFSVKADVGLDDIDHGAAPTGNLCVKAVAVCITKESIAPMVRKNLEQQLVPQIEKALSTADAQLEKAMNLKPHAEKLWAGLQQPQSLQKLGQANCPTELGAICSTPAWLVARPQSLAISQPRLDGKYLRVDFGFAGQFAVQLGAAPRITPTPLPKLKTVTDPPGFAIRASLRLPLAQLNKELSRQLGGKKIAARGGPEVTIGRIQLVDHADIRRPKRLSVVVSLEGAITADVILHGELSWDPKTRELAVKEFDYAVDSNSEQFKKVAYANYDSLRRIVAEKARWRLDTRTAALGDAINNGIAGAWRGHLEVEGGLDQIRIDGFRVDKDALAADIVLAGQLGITLNP